MEQDLEQVLVVDDFDLEEVEVGVDLRRMVEERQILVHHLLRQAESSEVWVGVEDQDVQDVTLRGHGPQEHVWCHWRISLHRGVVVELEIWDQQEAWEKVHSLQDSLILEYRHLPILLEYALLVEERAVDPFLICFQYLVGRLAVVEEHLYLFDRQHL